MKTLFAFIKKEFAEHFRSNKFVIFALLFVLFGLSNPALAKVTPWLLDTFSEALEESGMVITVPPATIIDSWLQFFSNVSLVLIIFVIIESSIFTKEYQTGTLILSLTKGLEKYKVVLSKTFMLVGLWTVGYWLSFVSTFCGNLVFWENTPVPNIAFAAICFWLFGLFSISLFILFSAIAKGNIGALGGTIGVLVAFLIISIAPALSKWLPLFLADGISLIYNMSTVSDYIPSIVVTSVATAGCFVASIFAFNKKQL